MSGEQAKAGELVVYDGDAYAVIKGGLVEALPDVLRANVGAGGISEFDLPRVSIPGGGGLAWSVPDVNGEPEAVPEIVGVVLIHGDRRVYWQQSFDQTGGGTPPDCSSLDARVGVGHIRGEPKEAPVVQRVCRVCPMSQWGSGRDPTTPRKVGVPEDNSQACSERKLLYVLRKDDVLPLVVDLATMSVKPFRQFMLRLASRGVPCYGAVVGLKLRNEASSTGIKYSVVAPRLLSVLPPPQREKMRGVAQALTPYFQATSAAPPAPNGTETIDVKADAGSPPAMAGHATEPSAQGAGAASA